MGGGCSEYSQFTGATTVIGADQRVALTLYIVHSGVMLVGAATITHVQILSQFYHWVVKAVFELKIAETLAFVSGLYSLQHFHRRNCCSVLGWVGEAVLSTSTIVLTPFAIKHLPHSSIGTAVCLCTC